MERNLDPIFKVCYSCKRQGHFVEDCPFLHYTRNQDLLIKKHLFTEKNERNKFFKRKIRSCNNDVHSNSRILKQKIQKISEIYDKNRKDPIYIEFEKFFNKKPLKTMAITFEEDGEEDLGGTNQTHTFHSQDSLESNTEFDRNSWGEDSKDTSPKQLSVQLTKLKSTIGKKGEIDKEKDKKTSSTKEMEFSRTQNMEFEKNLLARLRSKKKVLLFSDMKFSDSEDIGCNLFNYEYDKRHDYKIYYPLFNFEESLKNYMKFLKSRERKVRKRRAITIRRGMKSVIMRPDEGSLKKLEKNS